MSGFIYLAHPFWHESESVRLARYEAGLEIVTDFIAQGKSVYSPIAHNFHIASRLPPELAHDHDHWMSIDLPILRRAESLIVIMLPGWKESAGVTRECEEARRIPIHIHYSHPSLAIRTRLEQLEALA